MFCSFHAAGQTLAELEDELDSMIQRGQKSDFVVGLGYGNNPAYDKKSNAYSQAALVLKPFISPSLTYYHKSGVNAGISSYYLFNANDKPWFETDLSIGYDYTKSRRFVAGVNYTRYLFTSSREDIMPTPIKNEMFAYGVYRGWWLQPGLSVDFGWGKERDQVTKKKWVTTCGEDINFIATLRHDFVYIDVLRRNDAILFSPSINFTAGTANYYSALEGAQYMMQSKKGKNLLPKAPPALSQQLSRDITTGFEARAVDLSFHVSYIVGKVTLSPSYTVFKILSSSSGNGISGYFMAHMSVTL